MWHERIDHERSTTADIRCWIESQLDWCIEIRERLPRRYRCQNESLARQRLDKVFPVYLEGEQGGGFGVARNISEGGLFVETSDTYPLSSAVRVTEVSAPVTRHRRHA